MDNPIPVVVTPKPASKSLTILFNAGISAVGILLTLESSLNPQINDALRTAFKDPAMGEACVGHFTAIIGVANVAIRYYRTDSPIAR
jgi:hypothetical protein